MKMVDYQKADTALVNDANIGAGTKIWNFSNVYGCTIGRDCMIGGYVEIQSGVTLGDRVRVQSHTFICSLVTVGDDVFIGHGVMTINDLVPPSKARTGSEEHWKTTVIKKGSIIGSGSVIMPVTIGEYSIVGAGSVVTKDVPPYAIFVGNPARFLRYRKQEELPEGVTLPDDLPDLSSDK